MARKITRHLSEMAGLTAQDRMKAKSFASVLSKALMERGMSQSDLARAVWGVRTGPDGKETVAGRDRVSYYVRGLALPTPAHMKMIADELGMTMEALAPDVAAGVAERSTPSMVLTVPEKRPDLILVQLNMLLPLEMGLQIAALVQAAQKKPST